MRYKRVLSSEIEITKIEKENQNISRGITLVALVVSIVILLILAGISIQILTGEHSIINMAGKTKEKTSEAEFEETLKLSYAEYQTENLIKNKTELKEYMQKKLKDAYGKNINIIEMGRNLKIEKKGINKEYMLKYDGTLTSKEKRELMDSTNVYARLDDDGILYLRTTQTSGYREYISSESIQTDWNTEGNANKLSVLKVVIEEPIAPTTCDSMFNGLNKLIQIDNIDNLHTENSTSMNAMFAGCLSLESLDLSNFNTSKVRTMNQMFWVCSKLQYLDLSNFDTSKVTDMARMFGYNSLITELDLSSFNTENVTSMYGMFFSYYKLTNLDISGFNTLKVKDMSYMFEDSYSLVNLNISNFNTSNVTNMSYMFGGCNSLQNLDLSSFNTNNVTNMAAMFRGNISLKNINLNNFDTSKVENMEEMFYVCKSIEQLDLSKFNTSNVKNMNKMFANFSDRIELNLSNFNTMNVISYTDMFASTKTKIKLGAKWNSAMTEQSTNYAGTQWNI